MKKLHQISVAQDFSPSPAGRYRSDGTFSGEAFREDLLVPALKESEQIVIDLDGTSGYGSSFLEEAFGGAVRSGFSEADLVSKVRFKSSRPSYEVRIWKYIKQATK
jgi:STAS-like domain of unknown function (DUF4325)